MATRLLIASLAVGVLIACSPSDSGREPASPDDIEAALLELGLGENGLASWDAREIDGGDVRFSGFTLTEDEATLVVQTLIVDQPRMGDEGAELDALTLRSGVITYDEGQARFDQFTVRNPGPGVIRAATALFSGEDAGGAALEAQSFDAMAVGNLVVETVTDSGQPLNLSLAAITANGFDGESVEAFELTELAFASSSEAGDPITFTLDTVEAEGFASNLIQMSASRPFSGGLNIGDAYERFRVGGLSMNLAGLTIEMPEMSGDADARSGAVVASTVSMPELLVSADPNGGELGSQLAQGLQQLGFEAFNFSFNSTTVYDAEADRVRTEGENALVLQDGFRLAIQQDISGLAAYAERYADWLDRDVGGDPTTPPTEVLDLMQLNSFVMELEDIALLDGIFATAAAQSGMSPEAMRAQASAMVGLASLMASGFVDAGLLGEAQTQIVSFINEGGTLTIALEPDAPLPMGSLATAGPIGAEQGVRIEHTPPQEQ